MAPRRRRVKSPTEKSTPATVSDGRYGAVQRAYGRRVDGDEDTQLPRPERTVALLDHHAANVHPSGQVVDTEPRALRAADTRVVRYHKRGVLLGRVAGVQGHGHRVVVDRLDGQDHAPDLEGVVVTVVVTVVIVFRVVHFHLARVQHLPRKEALDLDHEVRIGCE